MAAKEKQIVVRLPAELADKIETYAEQLRRDQPGPKWSPSDVGVVPVAGEIEVAVPIAPSGFSGLQRKETADEGHCQKRELRGRENAAASPGGGRAARLASVRRQRGHESAGGDARGGAGAALRAGGPATT